MEMGDSLVLFTDGIPEAVNEDDEFYSFERLEEVLVSNADLDSQELLDAVMSDVRQFAGDHPQEDDITMVVLKATESLAVAPVVTIQRLITGERKSVTMLIAVGDDELPLHVVEEMNALMREHGSVVDALGDDTLVALFGVPVTHEDDAERAVTSARAIQELNLPVTFRIGIDTGIAIIHSDEDIDYHDMGVTLRRALQMANSAEPGQVLVSDRARQLTRGAFQYASATQIQPPDDESIAVTAYPVLAEAERPHRARGIEGLYSPMIGRDREMEQLTTCLDDLLDGRGGIVSITGEAGIGKTRLLSELKEYAGDKVQWLEGRCISYGQAMSYGPFQGIIGSYLGILPTDTEEEMKTKLKEKVEALLPPRGRWNPIHVGRVFFPQYEAELRTASGDDYARQYTYPTLRNLFHKVAEEKSLVLVFEDLHWADPSSLALLEFLMESVDEAPILYLWVYRPYRDSGCWRLRQRADQEFDYCNTEIDLSSLPSEQTDTLVSELLRIPDIPENMRTLVQDKASGNPLYVEEIVRSFIHEEVVVRDADYWRATVDSAGIVPSDTLQGVILARVDGLESDVKETLQVASVVGDSFPLVLLEQVTGSSENLPACLRALERAQMLQRRRVGDDWEYHFRHPLIHDVVYYSLLPEDRAALHERAGQAIESLHPEKLDDYTDLLAHHYGRSDDIEKALHYLTLAGDNAHKLASYWEALDYYGMAMDKAEGLSDDQRKKQVIVDLVMKRRGVRHMLGYFRSDVEELERYLGWVNEFGDGDRIEFFHWWLIFHTTVMGQIGQARQYMEKYMSLVDEHERSGYVPFVLFYQSLFVGDYGAAVDIAYSWFTTSEQGSDVWGVSISLQLLAEAYSMLGQWDECLAAARTNLKTAVDIADSTRIIMAHANLGKCCASMGEWANAIVEGEAALGMSPSNVGIPWIVIPLGDAYCRTGQLEKGITLLEHWKDHTKRIGRGAIVECECCLPLAQGYLAQGDSDRARANANEALDIAVAEGYAFYEAKAYRILGEIHSQADSPTTGGYFSQSLQIMRHIKARNEEGITELSWGRACQQHGDVEQAREHLNRAAEIFEELGTKRYLEWTQEAIADLERD
jgi:tetratricopeptide (TPR) repeat protein